MCREMASTSKDVEMAKRDGALAAHADGGVQFVFRDAVYTVKVTEAGKPTNAITQRTVKCKDRPLLRGITAEVSAGHVLAIMGPSGAGKTTLLNLLTLDRKGGKPMGRVTLNGKPFTEQMYSQRSAYVQQEDTLWATLSVRDHLRLALELYQPGLTAAKREEEMAALIASVGLTGHEETKAGDALRRGLSGGLKRRLSIALALAKKPHLLFLDEPTSGVDSASAVLMMRFLKRVAAEANIAVLCTIHQPPASVYAGFDNTLVLSEAQTAYFGPADQLGGYLKQLGHPMGANQNPAEFVLDLVNKDFTDAQAVQALLDKWQDPPVGAEAARELARPPAPAGFCRQVAVLTRRQLLLTAKEPMLYLGRAMISTMVMCFFSIIYIKTRDRVQTQATQRFFFSTFIVGVPTQLAVVVILSANAEFKTMKREIKDGQYGPVPQFLANQLIALPMLFFISICVLVPPYAITDLPWASFGPVLLMYAACMWAFEGMAMFFSLVDNPIIGMAQYVQCWFAAFLFSGMFARRDDVIWPFRIFCYVMPIGWCCSSIMQVVMTHVPDYEGAVECLPGELGCNDRGFYCPDQLPISCFGKKGLDIVESVGISYSAFSREDFFARNLGIILGIGTFWRLLYLISLVKKVHNSEAPKVLPPGYLETVKRPTAPPVTKQATPGPASIRSEASTGSAATEYSIIEFSHNQKVARAAGEAYDGPSIELAFVNCSLHLKVNAKGKASRFGKQTKALISGISGSVVSGEVLAIMGPSGAGKTVLLNLLTLEDGPAAPTGSVTINGKPLSMRLYPKFCAFVPRHDLLWAMLTARQHLEHAFALYRPELQGAARVTAVDELLEATGMVSAQHTRAGNALIKGLSGGQKRRLSLAIALVKQPKVLVLDEPTSGLDSAAAAAIMRFLKRLAVTRGLCVICTIHQPSVAVFERFDKVLMLSEGRTAYYGAADQMAAHFTALGHAQPEAANPAEFVLDLVSKDLSSAEAVKGLLDAWEQDPKAKVAVPAPTPLEMPPPGAGLCAQFLILLRRNVRLLTLDPTLIARMVALVVTMVFFGVIYIEQRNKVQENVLQRIFYLFWTVCVPAGFGALCVVVFNVEANLMHAEIRGGMCSTTAYLLANTAVQLPSMFALAVCVVVPAYGMGDWEWETFGGMLVLYAVNFVVWESMAQCFSVGNPLLGMLNYVQNWFISLLFCGFVFRGTEVIWPFRVFYYIMPFQWFFNSAIYLGFDKASYDGTLPCTPESCEAIEDCFTCPRGFYCPGGGLAALQCWGPDGHEIMTSGQSSYEVVTPDDYYLRNILLLLLQAAVYKVLFIVQIYIKCTKGKVPAPARAVWSSTD